GGGLPGVGTRHHPSCMSVLAPRTRSSARSGHRNPEKGGHRPNSLDEPWRGPDGSRPAVKTVPARSMPAIVADQAEWSSLYEWQTAPAQPPKRGTMGRIEAVESMTLENMRVAATTQSMNGCG